MLKPINNDLRLDGTITLLSPLSHIGESIGPDSYLSTDIIIGPDKKPVEVFLYSGNALRGHLRDCGARYLCDKLGVVVSKKANFDECKTACCLQLPPPVFYLLFSGGALGGDQVVDIDQARMYRRQLPFFSVWGGGVGNQILTGKWKCGAMYPLVAECQRVLPEHLRSSDAPSWRQWTYEKSFTRMDDAKNDNLRKYLDEYNEITLPTQSVLELPDGESTAPVENKKQKKKEDQPQQMRYSVEMLAAGSVLYQRIDLCDLSDLELGAWVSAIVEFSKHPYIGGKSNIGCGLVEIEYTWRPAGAKEPCGKFLQVGTNCLWLSAPAEDAVNKYDDFLIRLYDQYLENKAEELTKLLAAGGK